MVLGDCISLKNFPTLNDIFHCVNFNQDMYYLTYTIPMNFSGSGIKYADCILENMFGDYDSFGVCAKVSKPEIPIIKLRTNDLLLAITGDCIKNCIVWNPMTDYIIRDGIIVLRLKNYHRNIFIISAFLMSRYGLSQIKNAINSCASSVLDDANASVNARSILIIDILNSVKVPVWPLSFEEKIEGIYFEAVKNKSKVLMRDAIRMVEEQLKRQMPKKSQKCDTGKN
jgi:hypothetical protein